ncbi:outer membrane beta-barrel protein [Xanthocytophaga agilis]|uniref:Outer membrane beta-barrel protein n=1 Tax=Xanthocytophaga agilis TaxID=3048010 RepID=A0AAE3R0I4_9BACT|nr:outer membrane beta-barrel protein [Xanthocytophaga agilis]MDJ1501491.1 outer membrane beta-barrel protein [Xanthocytophaga agilis]
MKNTILKSVLVSLMFISTMMSYAQSQPVSNSFDVIIKKNGDIVYGLVTEVDLQYVKYKRTDIPDGPIYTMPRTDVYAISYRNQVKDILAKSDSSFFRQSVQPPAAVAVDTAKVDTVSQEDQKESADKKVDKFFARENFSQPEIHFHLGFIRGFTKVSNIDQYTSALRFPGIGFSYDAQFKENFRMGITFGVAGFRFTQNEYDSYDSLQINRKLNETLLLLNAYAKRRFGTGRAKPYILVGIGINGSFLKSESVLAVDNNDDRMLQVRSNSRAFSLGIQARIGVDYEAQPGLMVFGDIGAGLTILQFGIGYKL